MQASFRHEALLYRTGGFADAVGPEVAGALDDGGSAVVAAPREHLAELEPVFGGHARVELLDLGPLGANPGRIIGAWRERADRALTNGDGPFLGVGEPIWPGRTAAELDQCHHHEALINLAFADDRPWRLVCPYDVEALDPAVVADAWRTHPYVVGLDGAVAPAAGDAAEAFGSLERPLSPVPGDAVRRRFRRDDLGEVRDLVGARAHAAGLPRARAADLVLSVSELATNSVVHGGGGGMLAIWRDRGVLICQVTDHGRLSSALAGRCRPPLDQVSGRGLWLVHQLCDLVQVRSAGDGTTVRVTVGAA
jgi:anti-sigma regulatory factor (Ser/Thr protein kinase)